MNNSEREINLYNLSQEMLLALTFQDEKSVLLHDQSLSDHDREAIKNLRTLGFQILNQFHEPDVYAHLAVETNQFGEAIVSLSEEACQKLADLFQVNVQRLFLSSPDSVGAHIFQTAPSEVIREKDLEFCPFDIFDLTIEQLIVLKDISSRYPELNGQLVIIQQCQRVLQSPDRAKVMAELSKLGKRIVHVPVEAVNELQLNWDEISKEKYVEQSIGAAYTLKKRRSSH